MQACYFTGVEPIKLVEAHGNKFLEKPPALCFYANMLNLVLIEPDIPQNLGAMLRLSAWLGRGSRFRWRRG